MKKKRKRGKRLELIIYVDGSSKGNPGPSSVGAVFYDRHGDAVETLSETIGYATNNQAEYMALKKALIKARELGAKNILCYSDSKTLVDNVFKPSINKPHLVTIMKDIKKMIEEDFDFFHIKHVMGTKNQYADYLANLAYQKELDALES